EQAGLRGHESGHEPGGGEEHPHASLAGPWLRGHGEGEKRREDPHSEFAEHEIRHVMKSFSGMVPEQSKRSIPRVESEPRSQLVREEEKASSHEKPARHGEDEKPWPVLQSHGKEGGGQEPARLLIDEIRGSEQRRGKKHSPDPIGEAQNGKTENDEEQHQDFG